ncbi:hypothetical protein GBF38_021030, partial [Nibea albiflora]
MHGALTQLAGVITLELHIVSGLRSAGESSPQSSCCFVLTLLCSFSCSHQLYCRCTSLPEVYVNFTISRDASAVRYRG